MYYFGVDVEMLTAAVLPDGTSWQFLYNSWGNLSQVTLPTGGTFSYTYNTEVGDCDALEALSTKTTPDGTWHYTDTDDSTNAVKITDPAGNDTVYWIGGLWVDGPYAVTRITYYTGSESGGNVLKIENKDYTQGVGGAPILSTTTTSYPISGGDYITSEVVENYDSGFTTELYNPYGDLCDYTVPYSTPIGETSHGFSTPAAMSSPGTYSWVYTNSTSYMPSPGAAMSTTTTSLLALSNSSYFTAANLLSLPSKQQTFDGSGNLCSETDYAYDGTGGSVSSGVSEQHASAPFSVRGNLTSVTRQLFTGGCASSPSETAETTTQSVYDTGMPYYSVDPLGNHTLTYGYSSTYDGAYPTTVTNALSQSTTLTYDFNTGLVKTSTDPNSAETQFYSYDCMLRPTEILYPDGGEETWSGTYSGGTGCSTTSGLTSTGSGYIRKITSSLTYTLGVSDDNQGRQLQTKTTIDTSTSVCASSGYVYQDTAYNNDGQLYTSSNPDCTSTTSDDVKVANTYDGLGRVTQITDQDGSVQHISYAANSSTSPPTYCTTTTDEASHVTTSCADAMGRVTSVWEDPSGVNYETDYSYGPLGTLLSVSQTGGASSTYWRTRTFTYDSLARLTQAVNPESGTISYTYDGDNNVLTKVSPQANQTGSSTTTITYCYDAGNRLTGKRYTSSSCSSPDIAYTYDGSSCLGASSCYNKGRRTGMTDAAGSEAWSYDSMGRPLEDQRTTNSVTKTTSYIYNYDGTLATLTYPLGRTITYSPTRTYSPGAVSQPYQAEDNTNSIDYATSGLYEAPGALASLTNGSSIVSTYFYNAQLQPCRIAVNSSGTAPTSCTDSSHSGNVMDLEYNLNSGSSDNGNVAGITNNITSSRSQVFSYDSRNRIYQAGSASTSGTNCWSEQYSIDPWSNLYAVASVSGYSGCAGESWTLSSPVNTQNQINTTSSPYFAYDAAGNATSAPSPVGASYTYDAENHVTQVAASSTVGYVYDGDGKRVEKTSGDSAYKLFWYDVNGNVLDETDGSGNLSSEYVFFGGQRIARRDSSSNVYYYFADHLGSARVVTNSSGTVLDDCDYFPYGMLINSSCVTSGNQYLFTSKERDTVNEGGDDYFGARYYMSAYGRFLIPDKSEAPSPVPYADYSDPQTLNLYAYVRNNPLAFIDVDGHDSCPDAPTWDISLGEPNGADENMDAYDNWDNHGQCQSSSSSQNSTSCPQGHICVTATWSGNVPVNNATIQGVLGSVPASNEPQSPRQAATQYCQQHGQLSFNIPFTHIPVTISLSATLGPANYSATNDINTVVPVFPWPEWLAAGASVDFTVNAPAQPTANPTAGLGKNLSLGYFTSHNGPQGISLSVGPSIGPPINVAVPTNNACGMLAGGS